MYRWSHQYRFRYNSGNTKVVLKGIGGTANTPVYDSEDKYEGSRVYWWSHQYHYGYESGSMKEGLEGIGGTANTFVYDSGDQYESSRV
jgi:hypothetical protein